MSEQIPAIQPDFIELNSTPNRRRFLRGALAVGALALGFSGAAEATPTHVSKNAAEHRVYVMPATTMPRTGPKLTCDAGCEGLSDGDYSVDQAGADMQAVGVQVVDQYEVLDDAVEIDSITANYSPAQCDAENNPNYHLAQLDQIDTTLKAHGIDVMIDWDSPRLASIKPKILKCIAYALAKHYNGQIPGNPPEIDDEEFDNEENVTIDPEDFADLLEAFAAGARAGNRSIRVAAGGLRTDGKAGMNYGTYLARMAAHDPNPGFDKVNFHLYPDDWKHLPSVTYLMSQAAQFRLDVNSDWTNRDYVPGGVYNGKAQRPIMIGITESGARNNLVDSNGVSIQAQANYDGQEIRALENNTLGIDIVLIFHWVDEPAGPNGKGGWQLGSVHKVGKALNQPPVVPNKPMLNMWTKDTAETRAGATSATS